MSKNSPAMPQHEFMYCTDDDIGLTECQGLTKREYAAIKIMAGFAGNADVVAEATELKTHAVKWADELFDELEKGQ